MIYSVRHTTTFSYLPGVREIVMEVRMQPRSDGCQRCLAFSLDVDPKANVMGYTDFSGNSVHHFDIPGCHSRVNLTGEALVEIHEAPLPYASAAGTWQDLDTLLATGEYWESLAPSHYVQSSEPLERFASELRLHRDANPFEFLLRLNEIMYHAFEYVDNATAVDSPIEGTLRTRQGMGKDFAHIMITLLRRHQIPSRYVSGYLAPGSEGKDRFPLGGAHAWVEAFLPGLAWVAVDPANNLVCGKRHIRVALGRDYADVPSTRGVYKGKAESGLSSSVTVSSVKAAQLPAFLQQSRQASA